jgi:ElaB/YqjD/DUF883 family membrane-anchored ribosome-binding protein
MESSSMTKDMEIRIDEMRAEIAALRTMLEEKREKPADKTTDIRSMLEEGFARVSDAIKPLAQEAGRRIGVPARSPVMTVEEKIALHPFAAVMAALGAGFVVGKAIEIAARRSDAKRGDV